MEQAARQSSTWHAAIGKQGYPVLQRPASSCGRAVAQLSGGRCLGSHVWGVEPDTRRSCLAATSGYTHQVVRIACGRFRAERHDSSSARGSGARRQVQVRGGSAPTSGYGPWEVCTVCRQRQWIQVTMRVNSWKIMFVWIKNWQISSQNQGKFVFFGGKKTLSLEALLSQGWVPNVCPHFCWITRTVHFACYPLHRIEFGPPRFFSQTFMFSIIFYSTLQISGGGHFRNACRSQTKESKPLEITSKQLEPARTI